MVTTPLVSPQPTLFEKLGRVCLDRGLTELAGQLGDFEQFVAGDLLLLERDLAALPRKPEVAVKSAHHLLDLGGKHLRPLCVALAAKLGDGFSADARKLAMAVELVHAATLLHDDVVDLGDHRRGAPTARTIYGNAASVFAGDWLLIEALRRIRATAIPELLDRMLAIIDEMILAESLQLERRGRLGGAVADYFRIVEGKTAALFRWALYAGGRAGGLAIEQCEQLERYGHHLGIAFQAVDDLLDYTGDRNSTGKDLYADLREGKTTYPLVIALARDPGLQPLLDSWSGDGSEDPRPGEAGPLRVDLRARPKVPAWPELVAAVSASLVRTEALDRCRELARREIAAAISALDSLPECRARAALVTIAQATTYREG